MARKLYVGNLPFSAGEGELQELFAQAGAVDSVKVMRDMATGRARGFAFVEMATDEDAQKAIDKFHNYEFGGRNLTVNEARPRESRGGFGGGGGYGGGGGGGYRGGGGGGFRGPREGGGFSGGDRPPRQPLGEPQNGTVKFFNGARGFGFITPDGGGADVFVHVSAVERAGMTSLAEGQRINFQTLPDSKGKGPKAVNLKLVG